MDAIEVSYSYGWLNSTVDIENKSVILGDTEVVFQEKITNIMEFTLHSLYDSYYADVRIPDAGVKDDSIGVVYDYELNRADCTLYLLKDGYRIVYGP